MRRLTVSALFMAMVVLGVGVETASAASLVTLNGGKLQVAGDNGVNTVSIGIDPAFPDYYRVVDASGIPDPIPAGSFRIDATAIHVPKGGISSVVFFGLAGNDQFRVTGAGIPAEVKLQLQGGDNDDDLQGRDGPGADEIFGGGGNDFLDGRAGDDFLAGEDGDDVMLEDPATTRWTAAARATGCSATRGTTRCSAVPRTTSCREAMATTR